MVSRQLANAAVDERTLQIESIARPVRSPTDGSDATMGVRFLTSAARVLAAVVQEPGATMRDLARRCDRTERVIWRQLQELERAGLLRRRRQGRRNRYDVDLTAVERQLMIESAPLLRLAAGSDMP